MIILIALKILDQELIISKFV